MVGKVVHKAFGVRPLMADRVVDVRGLSCPLPLVRLSQAMKEVRHGRVVRLMTSDPMTRDLEAWCRLTDNTLLHAAQPSHFWVFDLRRGS